MLPRFSSRLLFCTACLLVKLLRYCSGCLAFRLLGLLLACRLRLYQLVPGKKIFRVDNIIRMFRSLYILCSRLLGTGLGGCLRFLRWGCCCCCCCFVGCGSFFRIFFSFAPTLASIHALQVSKRTLLPGVAPYESSLDLCRGPCHGHAHGHGREHHH